MARRGRVVEAPGVPYYIACLNVVRRLCNRTLGALTHIHHFLYEIKSFGYFLHYFKAFCLFIFTSLSTTIKGIFFNLDLKDYS